MSVASLILEAASKYTPGKLACRVCAVSNVAALAGELIVDSVQTQEDDRVLLIAQTDAKQNGPWVVKAGGWERPLDFHPDDARTAAVATTIPVSEGASAGVYRMTAPTSGEIVPDITATTWTNVGGWTSSTPLSLIANTIERQAAGDLEIQASAGAVKIQANTTIELEATTNVTGTLSVNGAPVLTGPTDWKESVRAASTANINLSAPGAAIDGVTMATGNRFLAKDQSTGSQNGIYVWNGAAVAAMRATDADTSAEVTSGLSVHVTEGTTNGDKFFRLTTNDPITLGTTALVFGEVSGAAGGLEDFADMAAAVETAGGGPGSVVWDVNSADGGESTITTAGGNKLQSTAGPAAIEGATVGEVIAPTVKTGASRTGARAETDVSGANHRTRTYDAAGNLAETRLSDDAGVEVTPVGWYKVGAFKQITSITSLTSATSTAVANSYNRVGPSVATINLPAAVVGDEIAFFRPTAAGSATVVPNGSDALNGQSGDEVLANATRRLVCKCTTAGVWDLW